MGTKYGGGENFDLNLAVALNKYVHLNVFIVSDFRQYKYDYISTIHVKSINLRNYVDSVKGKTLAHKIFKFMLLELDLFVFSLRVFNRIRKKNGIVISTGNPYIYQLLKNNSKFKLYIHWPGRPQYLTHILGKSAKSIANGDVLAFCKSKGYNIYNIPLGIDLGDYRRSDKFEYDLLFVGRIHPIKNLEYWIQLVNNSNTIKSAAIVGTGVNSYVEELKSFSSDKISWLGFLQGEDLNRIYSKSKVFLLTSHYDNLPNVILEAMARGLSIISITNTGYFKGKYHDYISWIDYNLTRLDNVEIVNQNNTWYTSWEDSAECFQKIIKNDGF
ncbi:MAG: glycosyltransferase family 4 protein [Bacteroidia bacterium]